MLATSLASAQNCAKNLLSLGAPSDSATEAQNYIAEADADLLPEATRTAENLQAALKSADRTISDELKSSTSDLQQTARTLGDLASLFKEQSTQMQEMHTRLQGLNDTLFGHLENLDSNLTDVKAATTELEAAATQSGETLEVSEVAADENVVKTAQEATELHANVNASALLSDSIDAATSDMENATGAVSALAQSLEDKAAKAAAGEANEVELKDFLTSLSSVVAIIKTQTQ
ncbi:hypothetical protein [Streptomyces sp. 1222.5]|uniref:hypothetical protein n=1 Tax=Streptomyces sp. 1222.5 TaxID=1881026 RepID=UPI003D73EDA9